MQKFEERIDIMRGLKSADIYFIFCNNTIEGKYSIFVDGNDFKKAQGLYPDVFSGKNQPFGQTVYFK
jgi:hypothetical protein